jgi:hypothetical protein
MNQSVIIILIPQFTCCYSPSNCKGVVMQHSYRWNSQPALETRCQCVYLLRDGTEFHYRNQSSPERTVYHSSVLNIALKSRVAYLKAFGLSNSEWLPSPNVSGVVWAQLIDHGLQIEISITNLSLNDKRMYFWGYREPATNDTERNIWLFCKTN